MAKKMVAGTYAKKDGVRVLRKKKPAKKLASEK